MYVLLTDGSVHDVAPVTMGTFDIGVYVES
jgi:hypothetical protein